MPRSVSVLISLVIMLGMLACDGESRRKGTMPPAAAAPMPTPVVARATGQIQLEGQADASGVQVYIPGISINSITDADGRYSLEGIGPGNHRIMARAEGYEAATVGTLDIQPDTTETAFPMPTIVLKPRKIASGSNGNANAPAMGSIRGRVTLPGGSISGELGACMIELQGTPYRTTCAPDGSFLLWSIPPAEYQLVARLDGFQDHGAAVRVLPGPAETSVSIQLAPSSASESGSRMIRGLVSLVGYDGNPTNDFDRVTVQVIGRPEFVTVLGADGSFSIPNLAPSKYVLTAAGEGYQSASPVEVDLTTLPEMDIQLELKANAPPAGARGRLRGVALKNVEGETDMGGITVALAGTSLMATTNADGQYSIENVPVGSYQLTAEAQNFLRAEAGPIEVTAGGDIEAPGLLLEPDLDYPKVVSTDPADGARNILVQREMSINIRFSKQMDPESLRRAISIEPEVAFEIFAGKDKSNTDFDLVEVVIYGGTQEPIVRFNNRYRLTISTDATDFDGLSLQEPYRISFTTGKASVISTEPADGASTGNVGLQRPVIIHFNAPMDSASLSPESVRIRPRLGSDPVLSTTEDPDTGWTKLHIRATWDPDTTYRITLEKRARTVGKDSLSNTPYTFSFKTAKLRTYQQPQVPSSESRRRTR